MPTKEIHKKGIQNIKDAHFVRKHLIPLTFEKAKWNLVVYQAYQSIELLIKGMIRLTGNEPLSQDKQGKRIDRHRIDLQVDHLSDILTSRKSTGMVPTAVIPTIDYSENDYYYLFLTDNLMYFGECVGGSHSDFDSGLPIPGLQADKLLDMRLEIENKKIIVFAGEEQVGLYHHVFLTNLPQKEAYEFQWELGHLPDNKQVENLKKIG